MAKREKPIPIPQTKEEAIGRYEEMLTEDLQAKGLRLRLEEGIKKIREEVSGLIESHKSRADKLFNAIFRFAQAHRDELTEDDERKTLQWEPGEIGWRWTSPATDIEDPNAVIEYVLAHQEKRPELAVFVRMELVLVREEMLRNPELAKTLPGVAVKQDEDFFARVRSRTGEGNIFEKTKRVRVKNL
jgi:phage host-nuclease inhibitor protein Gam